MRPNCCALTIFPALIWVCIDLNYGCFHSLQLAAIVYEHPNEAVRAAVIKLKGDQPGAASAAAPAATQTSVADAVSDA